MATFGNTTVEPTQSGQAANGLGGNKATLIEAGTVNSVSIYTNVTAGGSSKMRFALYNDSAGSPGSFVAVTDEITITNTTAAWQTANFATPPSLSAADYWIIIWNGPTTGACYRYYTSLASSFKYLAAGSTYSSTGNPPDPFGTASAANQFTSLYATYTAGGSAPANTVAPAVTGTTTVGQALSTTNGTWSGDPTITFTYQWQRDNTGGGTYSNIASATSSSYTLVDADDGCNIRCVVTGTNGSGNASANSNSVGTVIEPAPSNSVAPVASGTATVGQSLSTTNGTWSNMGGLNPTFTYQWQRDVGGNLVFSNIASATSSSYTLVDADDGNKVRCVVTAHNTNASTASANSNALGAVVEPVATNSAAPATSGNANVNSAVSATTGTWTHMGGSVATFAYQWQDSADGSTGWANIVGATLSGYAIASGELNKYLRCNVTATNTGGTSAATSSNVLGPVGAALPVTYRPLLAIHPGRFLRMKGIR